MIASRWMLAGMVGTVAVATAIAMPAAGAPDAAHPAPASATGQVFFTPASADPRLAAMVARSGLASAPFRFTPADPRGEHRAASIALPTIRTAEIGLRGQTVLPPVGIAPIAYSIGKPAPQRVAIADLKVDLGSSPAGRRPIDVGATLSSGRRSKFKATTDTVHEDARLAIAPTNMIDVGGSYSLSRNLDVTAGVRYKSQDRDRLAPLPDAQRDSQAVYVGTAFRF